MERNGTLDPGDVMVVSKDGTVSINSGRSGNMSGTVPGGCRDKYVHLQR